MNQIGIFGGTFDPIHFGHLRTAFELLHARLRLAEVRFVPAGQPPHRGEPACAAAHRLAMVRAAIVDQPGFVADDASPPRHRVSCWDIPRWRAPMPHRKPKWVPYGNRFTLVGMHGHLSCDFHQKRHWYERLIQWLERLMKWRRK